MDEAEGEERTPEALANRIIHINFVSLHTSIMVKFTKVVTLDKCV